MDIAYSTRSQFLDPCEAAVRQHHTQLISGEAVRIDLQRGGYGGRVIVTILPDDSMTFSTDWEGNPTRFPQRIKAAATALLNCGCKGKFEISHSNGSLTIRSLQGSVFNTG